MEKESRQKAYSFFFTLFSLEKESKPSGVSWGSMQQIPGALTPPRPVHTIKTWLCTQKCPISRTVEMAPEHRAPEGLETITVAKQLTPANIYKIYKICLLFQKLMEL